jgi:GAF domain-containing protein
MLPPLDRESLEAAHVHVMPPVVSKGHLGGILTLGRKDDNTGYTRDEIDLLSSLASESAVAIENAQIYQNARNDAERDGLTGLYNHRTFQELLNKEIEESTLSGGDFSLLIIDLDFFKTYNDIYVMCSVMRSSVTSAISLKNASVKPMPEPVWRR